MLPSAADRAKSAAARAGSLGTPTPFCARARGPPVVGARGARGGARGAGRAGGAGRGGAGRGGAGRGGAGRGGAGRGGAGARNLEDGAEVVECKRVFAPRRLLQQRRRLPRPAAAPRVGATPRRLRSGAPRRASSHSLSLCGQRLRSQHRSQAGVGAPRAPPRGPPSGSRCRCTQTQAAFRARPAPSARGGCRAPSPPLGAEPCTRGARPPPPLPTVAPTHVPTVHSLC